MCVAPIPLRADKQDIYDNLVQTGVLIQGPMYTVPCGKCYICRRKMVDQWCFRLENEFQASTTKSAHFLTLTYEDQYLEEFKMVEEGGLWTPEGNLTLNYNHIKQFPKDLRKKYGQNKKAYPIKYYTVGEYGSRTQRPHYHSIIFNADQQEIMDSWKYGNIHFGEVNQATITYTLKYIMKRIGRTHDPNYKLELLDRLPEKSLISKGIGEEYINTKSIKDYYNDKITRNAIKAGGVHTALPRYYTERVFTDIKKASRTKFYQEKAYQKYTAEKHRENQAKAQHSAAKEALNQAKRTISGVD